jgi:Ca-activated chloride channel homolog
MVYGIFYSAASYYQNLKIMKTQKILSALVIMVLLSTSTFAFLVKGKITDLNSGEPIPFVNVMVKNIKIGTSTDFDGNYQIEVPNENSILEVKYLGYEAQTKQVFKQTEINFRLKANTAELNEVVVIQKEEIKNISIKAKSVQDVTMDYASPSVISNFTQRLSNNSAPANSTNVYYNEPIPHNTEEYDVINENIFKSPLQEALSTFSIDVDAASYSNLRRVINSGQIPQKDMVRIEEMVNYFSYDYPQPEDEKPFSITTEVSQAPWNQKHQLVHIGLQGKMVDYNELKPSNLVFLIDVSGSMSSPNKLPLLKSSLKMLVNELQPNDKVAIVVYAGAAGLVLPSTPVSKKEEIFASLDRLQAGGSTAGGAGIKLAYEVAKENLKKNGNNRVILATDGDFNVGVSSTAAMVELIEEKRKDGIFLTITGFGMGNYKDGRMEQISNAGNGNYYYIDNIKEAEKVFVKEMRGTLFTIAKDVKIQIEFNPNLVQAYRLIGYENRMLEAEDFNDDKKDAGELGAGHTVTALYEIIPAGVKSEFVKSVDPLKYQSKYLFEQDDFKNPMLEELMTVKLRYKAPEGDVSKLVENTLLNSPVELKNSSENFKFSAAVAEFGMILRDSEFKQEASYDDVLKLASEGKGKDENGYRAEFIQIVKSSKLMANK